MKAFRIIDQWGWCYHFISREHSKFSRHEIIPMKFDVTDFEGVSLVYIHSPNIFTFHIKRICKVCKDLGIPIIGGYAGNPEFWDERAQKTYDNLDIAVGISPETYNFCKKNYQCPTIYMPEPVNTDFFRQTVPFSENSELRVGWAGGKCKPIKRVHLLDKLKYNVIRQSKWGTEEFNKLRTQEHMVDFYNNIDVLVLTSLSECQPRVVLEAMACGKAVISTDVGNIRAMLEQRWIVPVEQHLMVEHMNERLDWLKDRKLLKEVGEKNRERVMKMFSWSSVVNLWDNVFECVALKDMASAVVNSKNYVTSNMLKFLYN